MVLQEAIDGALLVVWHLEVIAEPASRKDDGCACTLGIGDLLAGEDLCSADTGHERAGASACASESLCGKTEKRHLLGKEGLKIFPAGVCVPSGNRQSPPNPATPSSPEEYITVTPMRPSCTLPSTEEVKSEEDCTDFGILSALSCSVKWSEIGLVVTIRRRNDVCGFNGATVLRA